MQLLLFDSFLPLVYLEPEDRPRFKGFVHGHSFFYFSFYYHGLDHLVVEANPQVHLYFTVFISSGLFSRGSRFSLRASAGARVYASHVQKEHTSHGLLI